MEIIDKKVAIVKGVTGVDMHEITVSQALDRIKNGKSKVTVEAIRSEIDINKRDGLKKNLPAVIWSGTFKGARKDAHIDAYSHLIVLDIDKCGTEEKARVMQDKYVFAAWISPSGNGVKALVKVETSRHRDHFRALKRRFPLIDPSGVNPSRLCFESYDADLYLNEASEVFKDVIAENTPNEKSDFDKLVVWLTNKGDAFVSGNRNQFIYKLASSCCRFGIDESDCISNISREYLGRDSDFSTQEAIQAIKSGYKANKFGSAQFEDNKLVDKKNKTEIDLSIYDRDVKSRDVIFPQDVKEKAVDIYLNGYEACEPWGVLQIDNLWKLKRGEISLLSGYGNQGKSTFLQFLMLNKSLTDGTKWGMFAPEDFPVEEYCHSLVEMAAGMRLDAGSDGLRISLPEYERLYDKVTSFFFFIYPETISPTPEYIKERFLELIIKEKISGCIIDPFNQLANDYSKTGGRDDKYLETFLSDISRFSRENHVYTIIIAHPKNPRLEQDGSYKCPEVFDIAGGAMWNNKMDNILIYHRPNSDPISTGCEFHSKKIRRQKIVGIKGMAGFNYDRKKRRFTFGLNDYIEDKIMPTYQQTQIEPNNDFLTQSNQIHHDPSESDLPF